MLDRLGHKMKLLFTGGKIEEGESPEAALRREIMEELETEVAVGRLLTTVEWDYPTFHLSMDCFVCSIVRGDLHLREHEAARWLTADSLRSVAWLPADEELIPLIEEELRN